MLAEAPNLLFLQDGRCRQMCRRQMWRGSRLPCQVCHSQCPQSATCCCCLPIFGQAVMASIPGCFLWQTCGVGCGAAQDQQPVLTGC